jgi:hypothetical protein
MKKKVVYATDEHNLGNPRATPRGRIEKDLDDQVHSGELKIAGEQNNEDPDDRVHQSTRKDPNQLKAEENPQDPDDLVHENEDEYDE